MANIYDMIANPTQGKLGQIGQSMLQVKQLQMQKEAQDLKNLEAMLPAAQAANVYTTQVLSEWNKVDPSLKDDPAAWKAHKMQFYKSIPDQLRSVLPDPESDNLTYDQFKNVQQRSAQTIAMLGKAEENSKFAKINPSQYTPESVAKFEQSGIFGDLVPREKTKMVASPEDYYMRKRLEGQATTMEEGQKASTSAISRLKALDRFIENNKKAPQGSAQPLVTGVQNFLASFGMQFEGLTSVRMQEQALGKIQADYMQELGARGLTDKDMEVLRQSLPRVATDKNSRLNVARILQKSYATVVEDYSNKRAQEAEAFPQTAGKMFKPAWNDYYQENRERYLGVESPTAPTPDQEADFNEMSNDQLLEFFSTQDFGKVKLDERP